MLFIFLLFEVTLFLKNQHFLLRRNAIFIDNHPFSHLSHYPYCCRCIICYIWHNCVDVSAKYLSEMKTLHLRWSGIYNINNPAESFFSSAEILLMFVLDVHSWVFFRALVQTFIASVLDQCNSTLYGTLSKLHQHWKQPVVSPLDPRTLTFARTRGSQSLHLTLPKVQYATQLLPLPEASLIPYRREDAEFPETYTFIWRRLGH